MASINEDPLIGLTHISQTSSVAEFSDIDRDWPDIDSWATNSENDSPTSFTFDMMVSRFGETLTSYPLEKWIHERFCSVYNVHHFAHDRFVRALLFSFSTVRQCLPTQEEAVLAMFVVRRLRERWPDDLLDVVSTMLFGQGMFDWVAHEEHQPPWTIHFAELSVDQRAIMLIFSDPGKTSADGTRDRWQIPAMAFSGIHRFLIEPQTLCPNAADIMSLPLVGQPSPSYINDIPPPNSSSCVCGECVTIYEGLTKATDTFRTKYFDLLHATEARDNCPALREAWEPVVAEAEEWVDSLMGRFQSSYNLFPSELDFRLGPLIHDVANVFGVVVGSQLDTRDVLRFATLLHSESTRPQDRLVVPPRLPPDGLGYFHRLDRDSELGQIFTENGSDAIVLSVGGGWLYDLPESRLDDPDGTVSFLYPSEELTISYGSSKPSPLACFCMPSARPDMPNYLPGVHDDNSESQVSPFVHSSNPTVVCIEIALTNLRNYLYPLLSIVSECAKTYPHGTVAAQVSTTIAGRLIQTHWKPDIRFGRICEHTRDHRRMTRCSLTSWEIINQVSPPSAAFTQFMEACKTNYFMSPDDARENLKRVLYENERRYSYLTERYGPFERHRLSIVRCGAVEGPPDPIVLIAGALGKKLYVIHARECWHCASTQMLRTQCTVGIAMDTKFGSKCGTCITMQTRANQVAEAIGRLAPGFE